MRPGLGKPGALPLLAMIVFSLLTLVPSLSSIYNLKFADFTYYTASARRMYRIESPPLAIETPELTGRSILGIPLIQDSLAQVHADTHLTDPPKSWIQAAPSRLQNNRSCRSARIENGVSTITTEAAAVDNRNRAPRAATDSSFTFSRRAYALRAYFAQQLDDYRLRASVSNRSIPTDSDLNSHPRSPSRSIPPSIQDRIDESAHIKGLSGSSSTRAHESPQSNSSRRMTWQRACHSALEFWAIARNSPFTSAIYQANPFGISSLGSILFPGHVITGPSNADMRSSEVLSATDNTKSTPAPKDKAHALPAGQTTDAAGRHSPQLQGSCMAVVIGLVAGIMWF